MHVTNQLIKVCAGELLKTLKGTEPSAGDVDSLSEEIAILLVKNHNVSRGKI